MNAALTTGGTMDATSVAPAVLLADHLKALKLPTFAREYDKVAAIAAQDRADYPRYLLRLCELERIDRERRMVERRIRQAKFPQVKSLDTLDFTAQPSLNKALVLELARGDWVDPAQQCRGPGGQRNWQNAPCTRAGSCCLSERPQRRVRDRGGVGARTDGSQRRAPPSQAPAASRQR